MSPESGGAAARSAVERLEAAMNTLMSGDASAIRCSDPTRPCAPRVERVFGLPSLRDEEAVAEVEALALPQRAVTRLPAARAEIVR
jgi:hypothetical protein